ncbi:MAG: serine/threonine-protein kinase, partial [Verrucomicrobiota bacterium]
ETETLNALFEAYEIHELLGRGGMGAVYQGTQTSLERAVAIKILPPEYGEDPAFAARFRREALAMGKLEHPNIVTIHDFGVAGEFHFIAMEFVEGADLHQLIATGELEPTAALGVVGQICDALQYAHDHGYVHRDIKPANIFVTPDGAVKVGDFGLAKIAEQDGENAAKQSQLTMSGFRIGTPDYMAPESRKDGEIDHRADIYSLGVMFYEMLTGDVPKGVFAPPSKKVSIDARLDDVVLKAMQEEPDRRFQQASEVKTEVEKLSANSSPAAAEPKSSPGKIRWFVIAVALLICAFFAAVLSGVFQTAADLNPTESQTEALDFPDISNLPTGRVQVFSIEDRLELETTGAESFDDIVEVNLDSNSGWFGLRSNGDVIGWSTYNGFRESHTGRDVRTLARASDGYFLSSQGEPVRWGHPVPAFEEHYPDEPIIDVSRAYPIGDWSALTSDGRVHYIGNGAFKPPNHSDFFRIGNIHNHHVGIRKNGEIAIWGRDPSDLPDLSGFRFADIRSSSFQTLFLTTEGNLVWLDRATIVDLPWPLSDPGWGDIVCGVEAMAARHADGQWKAWSARVEARPIVDKIESLGKNVPSLALSLNGVVWIETGPVSHAANPPSKPKDPPPAAAETRPAADIPVNKIALPQGRVHVWAGDLNRQIRLEVGNAAEFTDFVEVQLNGNAGWFGLRSNGEVVYWNSPKNPASLIASGISSLNRGGGPNDARWIWFDGGYSQRGRDQPMKRPTESPIVDAAVNYPSRDTALLTADGRLHYRGQASVTPPEGSDFTLVENWGDQFVAIRKSGEAVVWGPDPDSLPNLDSVRVSRMHSGEFRSILLTTEGKAIVLGRTGIEASPEEIEQQKWVDVATGNYVSAVRAENGNWRAWSNSSEAGAVVEKINSLGSNVSSISISLSALIWIEAESE